jgi:DNA-binding response OmpR family regulator
MIGAPAEAATGRLVMVDDSDEDYEALERALSKAAPDATLLRFAGSRDLFEHRLTEPPLVVLLDLNLPDENGIRVLHRLRSHPAWRITPVVIFSGSKRSEDIAASYVGGAAGYLVKPTDPGALVPQVRALWSWWAETTERPRDFDANLPNS